MKDQLKRQRSKRSRGPVCLRANSQALGELIWAEWNTNTLFMEIRPIKRQSSQFKEPSAGLTIKVFCSPLSSSLATFLSGKTRADKKVLLVGLEVQESPSFAFEVSNTYVWYEGVCYDCCAMRCQGISFVLFQVFTFFKFFFLPPLL